MATCPVPCVQDLEVVVIFATIRRPSPSLGGEDLRHDAGLCEATVLYEHLVTVSLPLVRSIASTVILVRSATISALWGLVG
jgi:hypothetical protein